MELCNIEEYNRIDHKKKDDKQKANLIISRLKEQKIHIIDQIGDKYSDQFCKDIVDLFEVKYGVRPSIGSRLSKSGLNIIIIHNAAYYIDLDDPHDIIRPEYAIQHITLEDFSDCAEFAVSTVVNELIIKNDLRFGNISLFEWKALGLKNDVLFGTEVMESETEVFVFMRIHPDGSFEIRERELDLFSADDYMKYVGIYEDAKATSENICGIICDDYGNINIIKETDWFSIPNISGIKEELLNDNNKLRGKTERVRLLDAILDIKWFEKDGGVYYFANDIGEGMRPTVQRAANIRQICAYKESRNLFKDLVPLLDVTFVRNGQLTVLPFPFKYLREYIKLHYGVNDNN